jgi:hypothetical protein
MKNLFAIKMSMSRKRDIAVSCFLLLEALLEDAEINDDLPPDLIKKIKADKNNLQCAEANLNTAFLLDGQKSSTASN